MLINEHVFKSKKDINYMFYPNKDSKYLVIVFSGYSIHPEIKAMYNYVKSIEDINVNKLFILDNYGYDQRGCWYLGENLDFNVEYSVNELINYIRSEYNIDSENIISSGSSKGGFASVYYGIKYKFGNIIVGAPQVLLYNYICNFKNILNSMEGLEVDNKEILNNIIMELDICEYTNFYIYCGKQDGHLKEHVLPLLKKIDIDKNGVYLGLFNGNHENLWDIFKEQMNQDIKSIVNGSVMKSNKKEIKELLKISEINNIEDISDEYILDKLILNKNKYNIKIDFNIVNYNFKYGVLATNNKNEIIKMSDNYSGLFNISSKINENYKIECSIEDTEGKMKIITFNDNDLYNKKIELKNRNELELNFKYYNIKLKLDENSKKLVLEIRNNTDIALYDFIEFAYYLMKDEETKEISWYSLNSGVVYELNESGTYNIRIFMKKNNNEVIYMDTNKVNFNI